MTPREAAERIGCDVTTVTRMCRRNILQAKKVRTKPGEMGFNRHGFVWAISESSVTEFMKERDR